MAINFFSINGTGGGGGGGGAVNTANGISGDGSVGTPVALGGTNPLLANTLIDGGGFALEFNDEVVGDNQAQLIIDRTRVGGSGVIFTDQVTNDQSWFLAGQHTGDTAGFDIMAKKVTGERKFITGRTLGASTGIIITDEIDNVGLIGTALFAELAPKQYAQYGNIPGSGTVKFAASALSANHTFVVFNTDPGNDVAYTITAALFATAGVDDVQLQVEYTSIDTIVRTANMGAALAVTGDAQYPPLCLMCLANTTITVRGVVSGSDINYSAIGNIVPIGGF